MLKIYKKAINRASATGRTITKYSTFRSSEFQKERRKKVKLKEYVKK